jgi:Na+-driven multidrug efflux pump
VREMKKCTKWIYLLGYPSILMQMLYTVYIVALNMILAGFSDAAVTVLGLYYKMQTFFFIPLLGLQTCIVPVLSYNYAAKKYKRCQTILNESVLFSMLFMLIGVFCFELLPDTLLGLFSHDPDVFSIGIPAFRIIGLSFLPAVVSLLSLIRQLGCLIPIFFALSKIGLSYTWIAFPASEIITGAIGISLYLRQVRQWAGGMD